MNDKDPNNINLSNSYFEHLVECYYQSLYRFALSLTHSESDACDLTQHTFYIWATKGWQLKDNSKVKSWLFTTLHRAFLEFHRQKTNFPHFELSLVETELPQLSPASASQVDTSQLLNALKQLDDYYRAAVALFYLEEYPYKDIARILDIPLGTVKSRIARGLMQLQKLLAVDSSKKLPQMAASF